MPGYDNPLEETFEPEMFDPDEFDFEEEPEDTFHFSLTELSVLIRVLKTVSIEDVKDLNDLKGFMENKTKNVLGGRYEIFHNDFGKKFFHNLKVIINYHSNNYETDIEMSRRNEKFILKKLSKLRSKTTVEEFAGFLYNWGIMQLPDNVTFNELKNDGNRLQYFAYNDEGIKYGLLHLKTNREMFDNIYNICKDNINIDKKVYIYWHLFLYVRMLIRNFVQFHNANNHYNEQFDIGGIDQEVSIRAYLENYDIFEIKANEFQQIFNQVYPHKRLNQKYAESTYGIIYYSEIIPDMSIEVHPIMEAFWPIIYTNYKANMNYWTGQECYNLSIQTLDPNTHRPTYPFYLFFHYLDDLSKDMLDHLILNELAGKIILSENKVYLDEDIVELLSVEKPDQIPVQVPPHLHGKLTENVYKRCRTRFEQLQQAHQQAHQQGHGQEQGHDQSGLQQGGRRGRNRGRNGGGRE